MSVLHGASNGTRTRDLRLMGPMTYPLVHAVHWSTTGDSDPRQQFGRLLCYHYTSDAWSDQQDSNLQPPPPEGAMQPLHYGLIVRDPCGSNRNATRANADRHLISGDALTCMTALMICRLRTIRQGSRRYPYPQRDSQSACGLPSILGGPEGPWSDRKDSNLRPLAPHARTLPN